MSNHGPANNAPQDTEAGQWTTNATWPTPQQNDDTEQWTTAQIPLDDFTPVDPTTSAHQHIPNNAGTQQYSPNTHSGYHPHPANHQPQQHNTNQPAFQPTPDNTHPPTNGHAYPAAPQQIPYVADPQRVQLGGHYNHVSYTMPGTPPPQIPELLSTFDDDDRAEDSAAPDTQPDRPAVAVDYQSPEEIEARRQRRITLNRLRDEASERLTQRTQEREAAVATDPQNVLRYTDDDLKQLGDGIARELTGEMVQEAIDAGRDPITKAEQEQLVQDIYNQIFRLGPIQHLIDEPGVEDIFIKGPYTYIRDPATGKFEPRQPAFDSDDEAIEWLQFQAGKAGRTISRGQPELRLNLPGGIRLSAMAYTSERPSIALRQHRLRDVKLDDLVDRGALPLRLARILEAAVRGAMSIVVAGPMGAGKTTMVRALANALPLDTRIGTAETEFELMLDQIPGREPFVVANETITGGGERNALTDELKGKISLTDILYGYVRQQLDRIIVGEVAGPEIIAMYQAMQFCEGTLSTTHATNARAAIDRLVTIALANGGMDRTYAERQAAHHIDLIVQLKSERIVNPETSETTLNRFVSEVAYVEHGEDRAALSIIYQGTGKNIEGDYGTIPQPMVEILTNAGIPESQLPSNNTVNYRGDAR